MHEFELIKKYFSKLSKNNKSSLNLNDDIYVTGNLGDSYIGLKILKKKINTNKDFKKYFENMYYQPNL